MTVRKNPDGSYTISGAQVRLHVITETISVVAGAPLMLLVASRPGLKTAERVGLVGLALGAVAVDGYLIAQFARAESSE